MSQSVVYIFRKSPTDLRGRGVEEVIGGWSNAPPLNNPLVAASNSIGKWKRQEPSNCVSLDGTLCNKIGDKLSQVQAK